MRKTVGFLVAVMVAGTLGGSAVRAAENTNNARYELAELLERAKVSLAQGLAASERGDADIWNI